MEEQILINYTPTDEGFTLSVMADDNSIFDYKDAEHQPKESTLQFISGLQELINEINQ